MHGARRVALALLLLSSGLCAEDTVSDRPVRSWSASREHSAARLHRAPAQQRPAAAQQPESAARQETLGAQPFSTAARAQEAHVRDVSVRSRPPTGDGEAAVDGGPVAESWGWWLLSTHLACAALGYWLGCRRPPPAAPLRAAAVPLTTIEAAAAAVSVSKARVPPATAGTLRAGKTTTAAAAAQHTAPGGRPATGSAGAANSSDDGANNSIKLAHLLAPACGEDEDDKELEARHQHHHQQQRALSAASAASEPCTPSGSRANDSCRPETAPEGTAAAAAAAAEAAAPPEETAAAAAAAADDDDDAAASVAAAGDEACPLTSSHGDDFVCDDSDSEACVSTCSGGEAAAAATAAPSSPSSSAAPPPAPGRALSPQPEAASPASATTILKRDSGAVSSTTSSGAVVAAQQQRDREGVSTNVRRPPDSHSHQRPIVFHAEVDPHWLAAQVEPVLAVARQALAVARQALAVARQLAHGVQTLNGHVQQLVDGVGRVARLLQDYLAARQLEDQRALAARCVPMGLLVMAAGLLWSSAVVGRLPEVGRICAIRVAAAAPRPSSLFGAASALLRPDRLLRSALAWPLCLAEQLGLYTAGVALLGYAALGLARHGAAPAVGGGAAWVVDIPLRLGVFVAVAGGHVLHCLGGAWTVWLVLWWAWCASLALLHAAVHSRARLALLALLVAIVLPYFAAVVPFYAWSVSHHGALAKRMAAMLHGVLSLLAPLLPRPAAALFSH